ncbi:hypothetical protein PIB30_000318 [Stylosanthes scabra]|uniref:Uncharacterized protein n=1 Tax=Stylosanthes scabra TaxID=79078 RepID=A0ABU6T261_9FABA|nr:hypothetical protein [Stylosanthes scabra]
MVSQRQRREDKRQPAKNGDGKSRWHGRRQAHATRSSPNDKTDDDAADQHGRGDDAAADQHGRGDDDAADQHGRGDDDTAKTQAVVVQRWRAPEAGWLSRGGDRVQRKRRNRRWNKRIIHSNNGPESGGVNGCGVAVGCNDGTCKGCDGGAAKADAGGDDGRRVGDGAVFLSVKKRRRKSKPAESLVSNETTDLIRFKPVILQVRSFILIEPARGPVFRSDREVRNGFYNYALENRSAFGESAGDRRFWRTGREKKNHNWGKSLASFSEPTEPKNPSRRRSLWWRLSSSPEPSSSTTSPLPSTQVTTHIVPAVALPRAICTLPSRRRVRSAPCRRVAASDLLLSRRRGCLFIRIKRTAFLNSNWLLKWKKTIIMLSMCPWPSVVPWKRRRFSNARARPLLPPMLIWRN